MIKLLICLAAAAGLAAAVMQSREQKLELSYESNQIHNQIEACQSQLWNQQLQIAVYTAPNAIAKTVGDHKLNMHAPMPSIGNPAKFIDPAQNPDAE